MTADNDNLSGAHWLVARDRPGLLHAMMRALAGKAYISFEGDLSGCMGLFDLPGADRAETPVLKRITSYPVLDFVVLPLEPETMTPIWRAFDPIRRVVRDVIHIQIEREGVIQFGSYDNFHSDCVIAYSGVPEELLKQLKAKSILRSCDPVRPPPE